MKSYEMPHHFCNLARGAPHIEHHFCAVHVLLLLNILEGVFAFLASSLYDCPYFFVPLILLALETGLGIGSLVLVFGMAGCVGSSQNRLDVLVPAACFEFLVALYEAYLSMRARVKKRTSIRLKMVSGVVAFVIAFIPSLLFALSKGVNQARHDGYENCRNYTFNVVAEALMLTTAYMALAIVVWAGMKRTRNPKKIGIVAVLSALAVITCTTIFVFLVNDHVIHPHVQTALNRNWLTMQLPAAIMPVLTTLANKVTVFQGLRPRIETSCHGERPVECMYDSDDYAIPWTSNSMKTLT